MKHIVLVLLLFLIAPVAAEPFLIGEKNLVHSIDKCEGPVYIDVLVRDSRIRPQNIAIDNCRFDSGIRWRCNCRNNFDVNMNITGVRGADIGLNLFYYLEYEQGNAFDNSINYRTLRLRDLEFGRPTINFSDFNININSIFVYLLIILIIVVGIIFIVMKKFDFTSSNGNDDVLNYKTKKEEDINDILNRIK